MRLLPLLLALALAACETAPRVPSYLRPPDGYTLVDGGVVRDDVVRVVEEYYAVRARAIAAWDATILYSRFPRLAAGEDRPRLINIDGWFIERMREHNVRLVTTKIEDRRPVRVFAKGDRAVAFVHGRFDWETGTAGEFYTRIDLERDGAWTVVRTDEVSESEAHER